MPKFLIERDMPGVGSLSPEQLRSTSQNSCNVLRQLGPQVQWVQSYVTADKVTCVYISPDEDLVREHARRADLPASRVLRIEAVIDPTTAEAPARR